MNSLCYSESGFTFLLGCFYFAERKFLSQNGNYKFAITTVDYKVLFGIKSWMKYFFMARLIVR